MALLVKYLGEPIASLTDHEWKRYPTPPIDLSTQGQLTPIGEHISDVLLDTQQKMLRQMLAEKTAEELIDALVDMVHLPDLLDFFSDDMAHFRSTH